MAKRTYPGVQHFPDVRQQISIRGLWDRIFALQEALDRLSATAVTEAEVQSLIDDAVGDIDTGGDSSGGGGGTSFLCDPLTDGDTVSPSIIFDSFGNVIMTCVPS